MLTIKESSNTINKLNTKEKQDGYSKQIRNELYKYKCDGIDEYIGDVLKPRFMVEGECILIRPKDIESRGWIGYEFCRSMKVRGFTVNSEVTHHYNKIGLQVCMECPWRILYGQLHINLTNQSRHIISMF